MNTHENIIANFYAFFLYLSMNSTSDLKIKPGFSSIVTENSVWPNYTFHLRLEDSTVKSQLEKIISSIDKNETPNYVIFDDAQVEQYEELLTELGFIPLAEWACLEYDNEEVPFKENGGLEVKKVTTAEELDEWVEVASVGFGKLDFSLFQNCLENKEISHYAGYYESKMVATAMLFYDNETAGIYHVVTLPEVRKRGFASHLYSHCQKEALQNGAKQIISQSTDQGLNAWLNTGMKQYGSIYLFCWNKLKE